jgi:hypothetical protein
MNTSSTAQVVSTTSSTTNLLKDSRPQKDYASALANLQDRYGLNGSYAPHFNVPSAKPNVGHSHTSNTDGGSKTTNIAPTPVAKQKVPSTNHNPSSADRKPKDYEAAFAALATSYGASGHAPSQPPRKENVKKASNQKKSGKKSIISWFSGLRSNL